MRLLVTRPQDEAERTAAALRARGIEALLAPVLRIEPIGEVDLGRSSWSAVIMTSGNAARALTAHPRLNELVRLPLFAVGQQTAQAARDAGFSDVISADGDGGDLVRLVAGRLRNPAGPLLYLAGSDRARDLGRDLSATGLRVETAEVYRAIAASALPGAAMEALRSGALDGVLHYSRRSTAIFVDCAKASGMTDQIRALSHYCLSARAAEPLKTAGVADIRIAAHPDEASLLALIEPR